MSSNVLPKCNNCSGEIRGQFPTWVNGKEYHMACVGHAPDLSIRVAELEAQNAKLRDALKAVEWINIADEDGYNEREVCSDCQMYKKDGHDSDCQLAKAIAACETGVADNG